MEFPKAIEYHEKHLNISKALNDRDALVKSCSALAAMYHCLNDPTNAVLYLEMVIDQLRRNMKVRDCLYNKLIRILNKKSASTAKVTCLTPFKF